MKRPVPVERTPYRAVLLALLACAALLAPGPARAAPEGQLTWGVHITLAPTWFDPAESPGMITPYMVFYALHDALVKPMPGNSMAPSLAASWSVSPDGLVYEFVLHKGVRLHNGDPARVRIRLKRPWPDFVTFYSSATSAAWIVPKKYVEKVGDDASRRASGAWSSR